MKAAVPTYNNSELISNKVFDRWRRLVVDICKKKIHNVGNAIFPYGNLFDLILNL